MEEQQAWTCWHFGLRAWNWAGDMWTKRHNPVKNLLSIRKHFGDASFFSHFTMYILCPYYSNYNYWV